MAKFAGVDEAGLGPMLGPLTLGFSVFEAPDAARDPWRALAPHVSDDPLRDAKSFVVADSKLVFKRTPRCRKRLEATALGFLALLDGARRPHTSVGRLLWETPTALAPEVEIVARHPWYRDLATKLPAHQDARTLELRVEGLWRAMERQGVRLLDAGVRVLPEGDLNRSFRETSNKAATHWAASLAIFQRIWREHAQGGLELFVDRHGGRMHYGPQLARAFTDASVMLVDEAPERSEYELTERRGPRAMRVIFAERAEQLSFAVALGSCLAKYARETAMDAFNAWFAERAPELVATAGYTTDARRWLLDAEQVIQRERLDRACLVRER
jgi:ribonuclease HII